MVRTTGFASTDRPGRGVRWLLVTVALALTVVIVAPIALSSQDLVRWAIDPSGLGLGPAWAWLAFVALDAAAAVCVGMVTLAAWRGEPGGTFHVLTWLFAAGSAVANYRHGLSTPARDDEYFFPAMSVAGPLLLDVTLARVRRWVRIGARTQLAARPRFGIRWLPGVAFRETLAAWRWAIREDIAHPAEAVAHVREVRELARMTPEEALHLAFQALGRHADLYDARRWLTARGVAVTHSAIVAALAAPPAVVPPVPVLPGSPQAPESGPEGVAAELVTPDAVAPEVVTSPVGAPPVGAPPVVAPDPERVDVPEQPVAVAPSRPEPAAARPAPAGGGPAGGRPRAEPLPVELPEPVAGARPGTVDHGGESRSARAGGRSRRSPSPSPARTPRTAGGEALLVETTGDRLRDAVELWRSNPGINAVSLAVQLRALGWQLSDRTAGRLLAEARKSRLSAVP